MYDLILRNGYLLDPQNGLNGCCGDVAIKDGEIARIGKVDGESLQELDLCGLTVTPGLIDFHAHFYSGGTNTALEFYRYLSSGVTNAVDAGSAGDSNIESFIHLLSEKERRNVRLYLNLSSEGLSCLGDHDENINPQFFNEEKILRICRDYSGLIIGLKLRISAEIAERSQTTSFESLRRGIKIADKCNLPISVHIPDFQGDLKELIDILRPGDIFCHVFTPKKGILENGQVSQEIKRAVEKGIILESACGKGHFGHDCAKAALNLGIEPNIISGDFTRKTYNYEPAGSLPYLMSRFLALGLPFEKVLACCTSTPARKMGMEGSIGCLKEGARANIAAFYRQPGNFEFTDVCGSTAVGHELLVPMITVFEGELVYRDFSTMRCARPKKGN